MIKAYKEFTPKIDDTAFIAETADIIGRVSISKDVSVWYNVVIRGDDNYVEIGEGTNIQDLTCIHISNEFPTIIGKHVTVGHSALVHACTVEDNVLIGMGAIVLNGAVIGRGSIVGAGALVTKNTIIPPFSLVLGSPAKVVRSLAEETEQERLDHARAYVDLGKKHKETK